MMLSRCFLTAALGVFSTATLAGQTTPAEILVDTESRFAQGDLVSARYSRNNVEFIGCGVRVFEDGFGFGFCQATDAEGTYAICQTVDPELIAAMGGIADFSFIRFSYNEDGECTQIGHSTQSFYLPKGLKRNRNNAEDGGE